MPDRLFEYVSQSSTTARAYVVLLFLLSLLLIGIDALAGILAVLLVSFADRSI